MGFDYTAIGRRIRKYRIEKGLTQDELRFEVGISKAHMSHIETGKTKISLPTIVSVANILGVTLDSLLCDSLSSSDPIFKKEIADIIEDCTFDELSAAVDAIAFIKRTIRKVKESQEDESI